MNQNSFDHEYNNFDRYNEQSVPLRPTTSPLSDPIKPRALARRLPKSRLLPGVLLLLTILYVGLAVVGIIFARNGGESWAGDTQTLTTILLVFGTVFSTSSHKLLSACQSVRWHYLTSQAIKRTVPLWKLHEMDMVLRNLKTLPVGRWGWFYRALFVTFAIATSAIFKKTLTVELGSETLTISGYDPPFIDPISVGSEMPAATWSGELLYNLTSVLTRTQDPTEMSWFYMTFSGSNDSNARQYTLPAIPVLVASGPDNYKSYSTSSVPALSTSVECGLTSQPYPAGEGSIQNGPNDWILIKAMNDGTVNIQVTIPTNITWSCTATVGTSNGDTAYTSDGKGNWILSSFSGSSFSQVVFATTQARYDLIAFITSDALGTVAGRAGFDKETDTDTSPAFPKMLEATRLCAAGAALGFSQTRMDLSSTSSTGQASILISQVVLLNNWALIATVCLLLVQGLLAGAHFVVQLGWNKNLRFDLTLLQLLEMRQAAGVYGPDLDGYCSGAKGTNHPPHEIAIRVDRSSHLALLDPEVIANEQGDGMNRRIPEWSFVDTRESYI